MKIHYCWWGDSKNEGVHKKMYPHIYRLVTLLGGLGGGYLARWFWNGAVHPHLPQRLGVQAKGIILVIQPSSSLRKHHNITENSFTKTQPK